MKSSITYIGIDICKDSLDGFTGHEKPALTIPNRSKNIEKLIKKLISEHGNIHIACEATGGYEKPLLKAAFKCDCPISLVNARCVRAFANAMSKHAKTDPIDAEMITRFAEVKEPSAMEKPTPVQEALKALSRRRASLIDIRTQEKNALKQAEHPSVLRDIKSHIKVLDTKVAKIEKEIDDLVSNTEDLKTKREQIEIIKGVGRVTSNTVLSEMPELGSITEKQASALVGVAPFTQDSGKYKGKRFIQGGRSRIRRVLYMAALSASRSNSVLSIFYKRLMEKGKCHRVAMVAVIRKLVCLLNRILREPEFKPQAG